MTTYNQFFAGICIQIIHPNKIYDVNSMYWTVVMEKDMSTLFNFTKICFDKKYPWSYVQKIFNLYFETNQEYHFINYMELHDLFPCEVMTDSDELLDICKKVIAENSKVVSDYKSGKLGAINSLKGQVMKHTKGKADMPTVASLLETLLK